jgi:hypothetical protein
MKPFDQREIDAGMVEPSFVIDYEDYLFKPHALELAKEDWVKKNVQLISEMEPKDWLDQLLVALSTKPIDTPTYTIINPYVAIIFSDKLRTNRPGMRIARHVWLGANAKHMEDVGAETWLWWLLSVLEAGRLTTRQ